MSVCERRAVVATGLIAGLTLTATVSSCGAPQKDTKQAVLQIGAIPDQNPEKLNRLYGTLSTDCLLYTSPSPRDKRQSRMPSSA